MSKITKPMLAGKAENIDALKYPLIATPKIDGIRCMMVDGCAVSRTFKPIPNKDLRARLNKHFPNGIDGELFGGDNFQECTSLIMSHDKPANGVHYKLFDYVKDDLNKPYINRLEDLTATFSEIYDRLSNDVIKASVLPWITILNKDELLAYEKAMLDAGHEGIMLRAPEGGYKCGRSTEKQGWLLKLKRFEDSEALIIGFEELMRNENEAYKDEVGHTKHSTAQAGMVPGNTMGKFKVRDVYTNVEFDIGTGRGLTNELRQTIWNNRAAYTGKIVKYKYQKMGMKDAPRLPTFVGFRDPEDM